MDCNAQSISGTELQAESTFTVDAIAQSLVTRYQADAVDVALAIARAVSYRLQLDSLVSAARSRRGASYIHHAVIERVVCQHFAINETELRGRRRDWHTSEVRHFAWALLRHRAQLSLHQIAHRYGRHHTTILSGCDSVDLDGHQWQELNRRLDEHLEVPQ